jgi:hypothetical protein
MSSEIMGFQMDPNHLSCFTHDFSPGSIGYRKYPLIRSHSFPCYVFLQTVRNLLGDEDNFPFLPALGGSEGELSVLDITGCQFQYLADPHPSASHQLKNQPVPGFDSTKDDFIHHVLFQNGPMNGSRGTIQLPQHGGITGLRKLGSRFCVTKLKRK